MERRQILTKTYTVLLGACLVLFNVSHSPATCFWLIRSMDETNEIKWADHMDVLLSLSTVYLFPPSGTYVRFPRFLWFLCLSTIRRTMVDL